MKARDHHPSLTFQHSKQKDNKIKCDENGFIIRHFAREVHYSSVNDFQPIQISFYSYNSFFQADFLEKNQILMPQEVCALIHSALRIPNDGKNCLMLTKNSLISELKNDINNLEATIKKSVNCFLPFSH